ncbi:phosphopantetheine-binding protein [Paraburkholderia sp. CNPSo 3076]|uniref:phosphopantetheine-binding protein n=1 Tax=Paraburkholderia sp. CNPSo 3076 TaxID=2940936 RepID=UPI0022540FA1|nr:phosphopantetheine-binding protein [Paraburkholderia sp. CNPSo 3076]MCX5541455.1 phosphopantetheine-binding protein [Paraburkholderia sp. CNPSo 3076]
MLNAKLIELLASVRPESDFARSSDFLDDGLLDSFDMLAFVSTLDNAFGISIDGLDIVPDHFRNLESISALLSRYEVTQ